MVIVGIDPGLQATGYGIIEANGATLRLMIAGELRPPRTRPLPERLAFLHEGLSRLMSRYHPDTVVLEQIFTHHKYLNTATLMGHARGVACLAVQEHGLSLAQYAPAQVKKSLTGNGAASKEQVARMVGQWLQQRDPLWSADATDALALAIIHAHVAQHKQHLPVGAAG